MREVRAVACLLAIASAPRLVVAQPGAARPGAAPTIALEYVAPASCPDEISVKAGVIARLGRDPFLGEAPRKAFVDVQATAAGFVAAIELREPARPPARRAVGPAAKCEDAVAALELALAVIIDPTAGAPPPPPSALPASAPAAPAVYEPPGWRGLPSTTAPPPPPTKELAVGVGGIAGQAPDVGMSFLLRAAFLAPRYRVGINGRLTQSRGPIGDLEANVRQSEILGEVCARRAFVVACGALGVGVKHVQLADYTEANRDADYAHAFVALAANAGLDVPLGRAFFRPTIELGLPLPAVAIESAGVERYDVYVVQLAFDLVLGYRW